MMILIDIKGANNMRRDKIYISVILFLMMLLAVAGIRLVRQRRRFNNSKRIALFNNEENYSDIRYHVIPHRGASGEEKEHTYAAYDLACDYGAKYLEQDCVFSKNGTLYVSHDLTANTSTGKRETIAELDNDTLDKAGVLKLKDVIDRYKERGITFVIEVRPVEEDNYNGEAQIDALFDLLKKYDDDLIEHVIVQAWDVETLTKAKKFNSKIKTMYLADKEENINAGVKSEDVDIVCTERSLMNSNTVGRVHNAGKLYCTYTVNTTAQITDAIRTEADLYFTNYVAKAFVMEEKYR